MIKVLFVTTSYGSFSDSQTIRYLQYLSGLNKDQVSIDFIVPDCDDQNFDMFKDFNFDFRIFKTKNFLFQKINKIFKSGSFVGKIVKNIMYYFFFPDTFAGFEKVAYEKYKEIYKNEKPDILISSSGSCTSHLACLKIKKKFGINWIADFGDPWSLTDFKQRIWFYLFSKHYEKKVFDGSDLVLFTTDETLDSYKKIYPNINMNVLLYGYISKHFSSDMKYIRGNKINIAHIGAAFVNDRNLIPTIDVLSKFDDQINFSIIGNHSAKFEEFATNLSFNVFFEDRISFKDSLSKINQTDVLILVGNKSNLQVPGKVFHYIASNRIVLYIYQQDLKDDPSYEILKKFEGIFYCENNYEKINEQIEYIINHFDLCKEDSKGRAEKEFALEFESKSLGNKLRVYMEGLKRKK
jgi:hypothetical protein